MSQLKIPTGSFDLSSQWRCSAGSNGTRFIVEGPTTATKTSVFMFSLPKGSIINYVRVYATLGSPLTGAAIKAANGMLISSSTGYADMDLDSFDATAGSYSVMFRFRANGAVYADSNYHYGTMSFTNVYLLIDYTVPNSKWSVSLTEVEAGSSARVMIEPHDESCSHELMVTFGSISKTYVLETGVTEYELDIPYEWLNEIPNSVSGVASLKLKTLLTGEKLGLSEAVNLTILCPQSVVPILGELSVEMVNPIWGLYVQNYSAAKFVLQGSQGIYGSTIQHGTLSFAPQAGRWSAAYSADRIEFEMIDMFTVSGTISVTVSVTDSRGRTVSALTTLEIQPYSTPSITQTTQGRANSEGAADPRGAYVYIGAVYSYAEVGSNSAIVQIFYREDGTEDWTLGYEGELASGEISSFGGEFDIGTVYELKYVVTDSLTSTSVIRTIGTAYAFMKWSPRDNALGFGCIPSGNNRVQIAQDWALYLGEQTLEEYIKKIVNELMNG